MPDGKILSWANEAIDDHRRGISGKVYIADIPADGTPGTFTHVPNDTTNLFCAGHAFLPDGRLFIAGGEDAYRNGSAHTNIFDYRSNSWERVASMNAGRWYPTTTVLGNGDVLVAGGGIGFEGSGDNRVPQVWQTSKGGGWRDLTGAAFDTGLYPRMHLAPNGKVFKSGHDIDSYYFDTAGTGAWSSVATLNHKQYRDYGSSVIYGDGKVIVMGGADPPTNTAEIIDLTEANPAWKWTKPMKYARRHLNATLLPDGSVLVTGGTSSHGFNDATLPVRAAEMWDPTSGNWTTMASARIARVYHSTALLLPDGRVLVAGGGTPAPVNGVENYNAEIFSPPYLFNGARPRIAAAPESVRYGSTFAVQTPDANEVVKATWIRLGSVTHAFDMNQRINHLAVSPTAGGVNVYAPRDRELTPPGHYMLFLINKKGVPSIARIVQIL